MDERLVRTPREEAAVPCAYSPTRAPYQARCHHSRAKCYSTIMSDVAGGECRPLS